MSEQIKGWIAGEETLPADSTFEVTPNDVQKRFVFISRQITAVQEETVTAEKAYFKAKGDYEIAMAHSRIFYGEQKRDDGKSYTETQKEDYALRDNEDLYRAHLTTEAAVRVVRAHAAALREQVKTTQSTSASIKSEIDISGSSDN